MLQSPSRRIGLLLSACLLSSPALSQTSPRGYDRLLRPADADFHATPIGLCEDYPEETTTLDIIRADLELLKSTGVDLMRISFGWDGIEGSRDTYDWMFWDEFVRMAVDEYGITLIPYICYTPLWNSTIDDPNNAWHYPPKDYDEFGEFVGDLVNRYKDRIKSWEIWNEPDIWLFWAGDQDQFAQLLEAGATAVRRADPEATVVMGGLAHETEWLRTFLRDHDVTDLVDVINVHNYYETWQGYPMEHIADYVGTIHDIVGRYAGGKPIWMAEVGYGSYRNGSRVSDAYSAYYAYEHTEAYQAVDLIRRITTLLATEKLSAIAWYEMKDLPPASETIGDLNNRFLGIATTDHRPKPAQRALAFFNRLVSEPMRCIDGETTVTRPLDSDAFLHAFEQEDGDVILVGWLQTRVLGEQTDLGDGDRVDSRSETILVNVPRTLNGGATYYDETGTDRESPEFRSTENGTEIALALSGGGVSIVHLEK